MVATKYTDKGATVATFEDLRGVVGNPGAVLVKGRASANDGCGGVFIVDEIDLTTADDNINAVVTKRNVRFKRLVDLDSNVFDLRRFDDGSVDKTASINRAIAYVSEQGGGLIRASGSWRFDNQIIWKDGVFIKGEGPGRTVFDFSQKDYFANTEGGGLFLAEDSAGVSNTVTVTSSVSAGAIAIPVDSVAGYAPNDYIMIRSTEVVLANEGTVGEIAHVQWADSGFIYLKHPLAFGYDTGAGTVEVVKLATHTGGISNLTIRGAGINPDGLPSPAYTGTPSEVLTGAQRGDLGIEVRYGRNWRIENVEFVGVEYMGVQLFSCINTHITDCSIIFDSINQLSQYGVAIWGATSNTKVSSCHFENGRHHVTTLSRTSTALDYSRGLPVGIVVDGNTSLGCWTYALDTHRAGSHVVISNNVVTSLSGGVNVRTPNTVVSANTIRLPTPNDATPGINPGHGISCYHANTNITITGNNIVGGAFGISFQEPDAAASKITVQGNIVQQTQNSAIFVTEASGVSVVGNVCGPVSDSATAVIRLLDVEGAAVVANVVSVDRPSGTQYGIHASGTASGDTNNIAISGNVVTDEGGGATVIGVGTDDNVTNSTIGFNQVSGCDSEYSLGAGSGNTILPVGWDGTKTIVSGSVTVRPGATTIDLDTEGGAATDDLDTLTGGRSGQILTLNGASALRVVTVKDGTGNMRLSADFALTGTDYTITLIKIGSNWLEIGRSTN